MADILSRRRFLRAAGGLLVATAAGTVYRAHDSGVFSTGEGPAYVPWSSWQSAETPELRMVSAAILAANPHNSQPWLFRVREGLIELYADLRHRIGMIDPFLREMQLGLGCALTNLVLAARAEGFDPQLTLLPMPKDATVVAQVKLRLAAAERSILYEAIPNRRTDRSAYDLDRPVGIDYLAALTARSTFPDVRVQWLTAPAALEQFRVLTLEATAAIIADEEQSVDSFRWQRLSWNELEQRRDGLTYDVQGLGPALTGLVKMLPPISQSQADQGWLEATRDRQLPTA